HSLATYDQADAFDHSAALGFIKLWGLPAKTQAQVQFLGEPPAELLGISPPRKGKESLSEAEAQRLKPSELDAIPEED
ncbi:MAG: hypothetical protein HY871_04325, partial [Chloroflexi bacterium]|nr:hypothetical protein [Chloroflexota bacterium]